VGGGTRDGGTPSGPDADTLDAPVADDGVALKQ
jgi:hypothetical protein